MSLQPRVSQAARRLSAHGSWGLASCLHQAGGQWRWVPGWPCPLASNSLSAQGSREPGETLPRKLKQVLRREFWPSFESLLTQGVEVGWPACFAPTCVS